MQIDNRLIKHYLRNVLFINGTSYAGKSTMVKMLADTYGLIHCGENYDCIPEGYIDPLQHPSLGYFQTMKDWDEFYMRTPEEYANWVHGCSRELVQLEITYLMTISQENKVIVDTNLPADVLREIADYHQVAIMLAPPKMSVERFFDRDDDKPEILEYINTMEDSQRWIDNYRMIIEALCNDNVNKAWQDSGLFVLMRQDSPEDTKLQTMKTLAAHFKLS